MWDNWIRDDANVHYLHFSFLSKKIANLIDVIDSYYVLKKKVTINYIFTKNYDDESRATANSLINESLIRRIVYTSTLEVEKLRTIWSVKYTFKS